MRRVNNTTSKRSRPLWTTCQGPLMLIAEFRALCCLATATASPPRRAVQASRRTPQQMAGRRWSPPRRVERTGHLSAPPGPLAPQRDIDRPLRVNRVTVTVSDLGRQPLGQRSPAATPLPPEVTMPSPSVWFTPSLRYETWPATWVSAAQRFCRSPRLSGYGPAAHPASSPSSRPSKSRAPTCAPTRYRGCPPLDSKSPVICTTVAAATVESAIRQPGDVG